MRSIKLGALEDRVMKKLRGETSSIAEYPITGIARSLRLPVARFPVRTGSDVGSTVHCSRESLVKTEVWRAHLPESRSRRVCIFLYVTSPTRLSALLRNLNLSRQIDVIYSEED